MRGLKWDLVLPDTFVPITIGISPYESAECPTLLDYAARLLFALAAILALNFSALITNLS